MLLLVSVKYSTTQNGYPGMGTNIRIESPSTNVTDVKEIVQAKYPHWYKLQITGIKQL